MERLAQIFKPDNGNFFGELGKFVWVLVVSLTTYLAAIKGTIHVLWVAMIFDLALGIIKARRVDKLKFSGKKFKYWAEYVVVMTALIVIIFSIEKEMDGLLPVFYKGFFMIVIVATIFSAVRNAEAIYKKYIFTVILDYLNKKVLDLTGIDLRSYKQILKDKKNAKDKIDEEL